MKAIGSNIIITPEKIVTEKSKGGLLIIEKDREDIRYRKATIYSVSDEIKALKKGDKIYYDKHAGHGVEFDKEKYTVIKLQDVVVVL
jgi:co-chaperonin GroES (HSP10)|tara:strand:+ start:402 stop:662 length:261 start_codon:yes stop_codon:yes gene_type:complete